jgi:O-antigen ligase
MRRELAYAKMEDLRQGQGIIDLVNTYIEVALFYGLCGLSLFCGFILVGLFNVFRLTKANIQADPDFASLGICIAACILGSLLMMASNSFRLGPEKMYYVLAGLAAAYGYLGRSQRKI